MSLKAKINILGSVSHISRARGYIRRLKNVRTIGFLSTLSLLALTSLSIFPIINHQDQAEATLGTPEVPTLAMVVGKEKALVDLTPVNKNGTFASSDDTTVTTNTTAEFTVNTSNYTGYNLVFKASSADTNPDKLTNATTGDTLSSITTATSEADFSANTSAAATNYNGKWGFKPSKLSGVANSNYLPAPTTSGTLLDTTTGANTTANNYTIAIGARADYTKPSGTYTNTYELIATANPVAYAILYYDLSGIGTASSQKNDAGLTWNTVSGSTAKEATYTEISRQTSAINTAATITLTPPTGMARDTYTFAGWCRNSTNHTQIGTNKTVTAIQNSSNKVTAYNNPSTMCNGAIPNYNTSTDYFIKAGDTTFKLDPTKDNNTPDGAIILTAVWKPTTFATAGIAANANMQTMTSTICNSTTPNQFTTLRDSRDNVSYTIIKMLDGHCWMADNLDFDAYYYRNSISSSNTHITSGTTYTNVLNRFKGASGASYSTTDQYASASINSSNSASYTDPSPSSHTTMDWTSSYSYSVPMVNRHGVCQNTLYMCLYPYQKKTSGSPTYTGEYDHTKVINLYGTTWDSTTGEGTANISYNFGPGGYKVGTYYNYCAATLGYFCWGDGTSAGSPTQSQGTDITGMDICPANWKLPSSGASGDFQNLYNKIGLITTSPAAAINPLSFQAMLSTPVSGLRGSASAGRQGTYGLFWSSTYYDAMYMRYANASGAGVAPQNYGTPRLYGFSVRCVAQ